MGNNPNFRDKLTNRLTNSDSLTLDGHPLEGFRGVEFSPSEEGDRRSGKGRKGSLGGDDKGLSIGGPNNGPGQGRNGKTKSHGSTKNNQKFFEGGSWFLAKLFFN